MKYFDDFLRNSIIPFPSIKLLFSSIINKYKHLIRVKKQIKSIIGWNIL